jgi:peptide/nickel transport system substrate-binding protein
MRSHKRGIVATVFVLALSLVLSACSKATPTTPTENKPSSGPTGPKGTFVYANVQDAKVLNPILSNDVYSSVINDRVYDGLMSIDDQANLKPNLAKSWDVSPDNQTITFKLRDDVKWHDGQKFTAKDVAFTFQAIMHPDYTGPRRSDYTAFKGIKQLDEKVANVAKDAADRDAQRSAAWQDWVKNGGAITIKDDYTIQFQLDQVFAPVMVNLALRIIPEHLYRGTEGKKMADADPNQKPIGTGPMKFVEWKKGDSITLENSPDYKWGLLNKPFNLKTFVFKVVPDGNAAMAALENGEVDFASIDADSWDKFTKLPNVQTFEYLGWSYQFIGYNMTDPIIKDAKVRQALTSALDRESIVKDLKRGHAKVADTHGAPGRWDFNDKVTKWPFDPAKAGKLLDEAGWKPGSDGIRVKDGKKLSITFTFSSGDKYLEQLATFIQQSWKKVGVDAKIEAMKFEAILDAMKADKVQAFTIGWSLGVEPDAHSIFHSKGGFNWVTHWGNTQVDKLLEDGRLTMDQAKRKAIYSEMQEILAQEQPYTWLSFNNSLSGFSKRVHGVKPSSAVGVLWNMADWTVDGK